MDDGADDAVDDHHDEAADHRPPEPGDVDAFVEHGDGKP